MLKKIAVTGGVASGKTTVCNMFEKLGASVIYADKIVHELLNKSNVQKKIIEAFGPSIVKEGHIDRRALAVFAFNDPKKLKVLEEIIHPSVLKQIDQEYRRAKGTCFIVEIPLLYEIGAQDDFDIVIAVIAEEQVAKNRFIQKGFTEEEFELRMKRQLKPEEKAGRSHYTIQNNGTLASLESQVSQFIKNI